MVDEYNLKNDDILYFLHIPKTAGITFTTILEDNFDYDSIYTKRKYDELICDLPQDFTKYKLFAGHFGYGFYKILSKKPVYMTMLRNPLERTISNFEHNLRNQRPDVTSLPEKIRRMLVIFQEHTFRKYIYKDTQTYHIGLDFDALTLINSIKKDDLIPPIPGMLTLPVWLSSYVSDYQALELAKKHLNEFAFFGLTERFQESMLMLYYTFGWKPRNNMLKLNEARSRLQIKDIPTNVIECISNLTKLDCELYSYAENLFEERFTKMVETLRRNHYKSSFDKLDLIDAVFEMLKIHYENRMENNEMENNNKSKSTMDSIDYNFKQPLNGEGWYSREFLSNSEVFRWTGPDTASFIDFPLKSDKDMEIKFQIINCLDEDILSSLKLKVNDSTIDIKIDESKDMLIFYGIVPRSVVDNSKFIRLTFEVNHTTSPHSIDPQSNDDRKLGLAFKWLSINPINSK